MSKKVMVSVRNLHKKFWFFRKDFAIIKWLFTKKGYEQEFHVLKGIDFDIYEGESVGILGINGAGKSTLLKIISEIYYPTSGTVEVNGVVSSLLELGAGFNAQLTGRENIYLKATYLGKSKDYVDLIMDDIIEFAELGKYIDMPMSSYSSGMMARLGFAMAINIEPEILIIDEVFAVGDKNFQEKSRAKTTEFFNQGKTILFVSHSEQLVREFCNRVIYLKDGHIEFDGSVEEGLKAYNKDVVKSSYIPRFFLKKASIKEDIVKLEFAYGLGYNKTIHKELKLDDYKVYGEKYSGNLSNHFVHSDIDFSCESNPKTFSLTFNINEIENDMNMRLKIFGQKWTNFNYFYGFDESLLLEINEQLKDTDYSLNIDSKSLLYVKKNELGE